MKRTLTKTAGAVLVLLMIISYVPAVISAERIPTAEVIFTFTDTGVTAEALSLTDRTDGYELTFSHHLRR